MRAGCNCLCVVSHPNHSGICTGEEIAPLRFSNFSSDSPLFEYEHVDVQMCKPCRVATLAHQRAKESDG